MVKYTTIDRVKKTNGNKYYRVKLVYGKFDANISMLHNGKEGLYCVYYTWYNGKRECSRNKDFDTLPEATKFYQSKIAACEEKIK